MSTTSPNANGSGPHPSRKLLSVSELLNAPPVEVDIPELDGVVRLRQLSALEAIAFFSDGRAEAARLAAQGGTAESTDQTRTGNIAMADLLTRTAVNEDGSMLFEGVSGEQLLRALGFSVYSRLAAELTNMLNTSIGKDAIPSPFVAKGEPSSEESTASPENSESGTSTAG